MNIYDISKQSGVSIATVSRVLNNSGYVSEKTRAKVLKVIEQNNYSPNAFARGMANSTMSTIGILCSDAGDLYQAQCIHFLEPLLKKKEFAAIVSCTGYDEKNQENDLQLLLERNVDALILIGSHFISENPKKNEYIVKAAQRIPVCLLNGFLDAENVFCVLHDDEEAARKLTDLVLERGSRAPVFLFRHDSGSTQRKRQGFLDACARHGVTGIEKRVGGDFEEIGRALLDLLQEEGAYDALVACDDEIAVAALKSCQKAGISVPDEMQVTGFNASVLSRACSPELTSYDNRLAFMCEAGMNAIMPALHHEDYPLKTTYNGKLVERDSTRK